MMNSTGAFIMLMSSIWYSDACCRARQPEPRTQIYCSIHLLTADEVRDVSSIWLLAIKMHLVTWRADRKTLTVLFVVLSYHSCLQTLRFRTNVAYCVWFISLYHSVTWWSHYCYCDIILVGTKTSSSAWLRFRTTNNHQCRNWPHFIFAPKPIFLQTFGALWVIILNGDQSTVLLLDQSLKSFLEDIWKHKHETFYSRNPNS